MYTDRLREMMRRVRSGELSVDAALAELRHLPFESLEEATIDHHRSLRCGFPEVVFCGGKSERQIVAIVEKMVEKGEPVLATRVKPGVASRLARRFPHAEHNSLAHTVFILRGKREKKEGLVLVVSAGTSDIPVAEEACVTAEAMGCKVERLFDVGIAGIHRIISHRRKLWDADAIVVAAGMEGALAGVVAGMTDRPVVAVPTSVGYGASFGGIAALLGMLNSCAAGVTVVNIDNGFGAGYAAALVARRQTATGVKTRKETGAKGTGTRKRKG
ncbi:MAG: nickel pincer cofactor biosynthesis protein LarB [Candidatus Eisenbacteria bacterium]|nr:nickel pincer cofactor biosynthesis protein LarB [Candidatus Eisenbacteria bacterium]